MEGKRGSECLLKSVSNIDFNPNVTTDLLMKICTGLDCNLNDICETVSINEKQEKFDANR
ncbi:hypothetical protein DQM07_07505 [Lacticaseibacillus paracasei subsp. paracasei]|nr:hypothetical protein DQM07_07505 [Lacticaseibacillus paracasei subsp. paracasei]